MKPVEIEFLVLDKTKDGAQRVSASVDRAMLKILGKMDKVQAKIDKLRSSNNDAFDQDKNIAEIQKLEKQLDQLKTKMAQVSATSIGPSATELEAVTQKYNGLNTSIQQIARELPVAAMGPQMFFMAISNNLPIFTDELARARKEYEALVASGQKGVPVWKQVLSSIVSWQTALIVGIMLLITYGDEIGNWVKKLFSGKSALDAASVAAQEYNDAMAKGRVSAAKDISQAETLLKVAIDESRAMDQRREAAKKMQQLYPDYLGNMSAEAVMAGEAAAAYNSLKNKLIEVAQSRAAMNRLSELAAAKLSPELDAVRQASEAYDAAKQKQNAYLQMMEGTNTEGAYWASRSYGGVGRAERELSDATEAFAEKYGIVGADIIEINNAIEESERKLISAVTAFDDESKKSTKTPTGAKGTPVAEQILKAQRELEDDQNAIIEDGYAKRRAIAQTEFERQLSDIRKNREKLLAEDRKETGGASADQINSIFEAQIVAVTTQYKQALTDINNEEQEAATKIYNDLLQKYETYQQQRARIAAEYDAEIAALATSPENQKEAEKAKDKALMDLDVKFARQFPEFEAWANSIVSYSAEKLMELLDLAQVQLEELETSMDADPGTVAKLRARIAELEAELAKKIGKNTSSDGADAYEEWSELGEVLERVDDQLKDIGKTAGGAVEEILDVASTIATSTLSIISGIKTLADAAIDGTVAAATGAAAAIKAVERASVILAIISAVISAIQAIASLFKQAETSQERNIRLAKELNEELRIMNERARINKNEDSIFGDAVYQNFRNNIEVMRDALNSLEETAKKIDLSDAWIDPYGLGNMFLPTPSLQARVNTALHNMLVQTQHSTWFRSAKYASLKDLVPELFGDDGQINMDALSEFADESNETFQKLSDSNKALVKSLVADWETYEEALEAVRDYLSSIFGELGDTIMDSMMAVADGTMTAADAMTTRLEALSDVVKNFAKQMIYSMTIGPILEQAQKDIEAIQTGTGTDDEKFEAMLAILSQMSSDVSAKQDMATELYEQYKAMAAKNGIDIEAGNTVSQTGKAGAMYTVNQDSFTRMEGIATSIQGHSASMDLKMDNITSQMAMHLDALNVIANNTSPIGQIYSLLVAIERDGINVK